MKKLENDELVAKEKMLDEKEEKLKGIEEKLKLQKLKQDEQLDEKQKALCQKEIEFNTLK